MSRRQRWDIVTAAATAFGPGNTRLSIAIGLSLSLWDQKGGMLWKVRNLGFQGDIRALSYYFNAPTYCRHFICNILSIDYSCKTVLQ